MQFKLAAVPWTFTSFLLFLVALLGNATQGSAVNPWMFVSNSMALPLYMNSMQSYFNAPTFLSWPSMDYFWGEAFKLKAEFVELASDMIDEISSTSTAVAAQVTSIQAELAESLKYTLDLNTLINSTVVLKGTNMDEVSAEISREFTLLMTELEKAFPRPSEAERHAHREKMVDETFSKLEEVLARVLTKHGVPEDEIRKNFGLFTLHMKRVVVVTGDLVEQHPDIVFAVAALAIPFAVDVLIFRHILAMIGFGLEGPAAGSAAAWIQSRYWGGAVVKGSWFSHLQRAGMKGAIGLGKKVAVGIGAGITIGLGVVKFSACGCS